MNPMPDGGVLERPEQVPFCENELFLEMKMKSKD